MSYSISWLLLVLLLVVVSMWSRIRSWWISTSPEKADECEAKIFASCHGTRVEKLAVSTRDGHTIHTVVATSTLADARTASDVPLVLTHGFGAGVGFWAPNLPHLTLHSKVFAFDWLGFGRSSRPSVRFHPERLDHIEDFFVESLEQWRESLGIERMNLLGHSLGGYFVSSYALKYPHRVNKLILASPAGVSEYLSRRRDKWNVDQLPFYVRWPIWCVRKLWSHHISPQDIMRFLGPFGKRLVYFFVHGRFRHVDMDHALLAEYVYQINALPGSGEYSLLMLFEPFGAVKRPIYERLINSHLPMYIMYGESDWMDPSGALILKDKKKHGHVQVAFVEGAGHQLFLENPMRFHSLLREIVEHKHD